MGASGGSRENRGNIHRILTCWRCDGLGFQPPRIANEVCELCAGHGRMVRRPDGAMEPLEEPQEAAPREQWSQNDWLFGGSSGRPWAWDDEPDWPV